MSKNDLDFMHGVYKCKGNIDQLRVRVRLEIIKSTVIPISNAEEQETGLDSQNNEIEEKEFLWQEKVFSGYELKHYSDKSNCHTSRDEEYYEKSLAIISNNTTFPENQIFSSTDKDEILDESYKSLLLTEDGHEYLSHQRQYLLVSTDVTANESNILPTKQIVDYLPSDTSRILNRSMSSSFQSMHILADLSDGTSTDLDEDARKKSYYLLVTLKWNPKTCTLSVLPDFTNFDTAGYKIETNNIQDTRYEYRYWFTNICEKDEHSKINTEKHSYRVSDHRHCIKNPTEFITPSKHIMDVYVFGEIQKSTGFEYNHLFAHYFIHLPDSWSSESVLSGVTQRSYFSDNNIAIFSHPIEMKLTLDLLKHSEETGTRDISDVDIPQIFIEMYSLDEWGRYRAEGYTWTSLPLNPGCHHLILNTWRPAPVNFTDKLRRYFIGSNLQICDPLYSGIPKNKESLLSRYGFQTISSGDVFLKLNVALQLGNSAGIPAFDDKKATLFSNHLSTTTVVNSVNNILEAFKKARQRMLLARESIIFHAGDIIETEDKIIIPNGVKINKSVT